MKIFHWSYGVAISLLFIVQTAVAQVNDCISAGVICDDGVVSFTSAGAGIDDFASPNNSSGCLQEGERQSAWYYFEFMPNMPSLSQIELSIAPTQGNVVDFDFAIYGANVECDSLGSPLRCSFAFSSCAFCPATGLGNGAQDLSEGANGDGFLAPLTVVPGAGYYLLIDNWLESSISFNLEWGGSAAAYLNCNADPNCPIVVDLGPDITTCVNPDPIQLSARIDSAVGDVVYNWTASDPDHIPYLSNTQIANPVLNVPNNFIGVLEYHLTVADSKCFASNKIIIDVSNQFAPEIIGPEIFCQNVFSTLSAGVGFESYRWTTGETTASIKVQDPGVYGVTVTSAGGCVSIDEIELKDPLPSPVPPVIFGDTVLCNEASGAIRVLAYYETYQWSHGTRDPGTLITESGKYSVTVTNEFGCPAYDDVEVKKINADAIQVDLGDNQDICYNEVLALDPGDQFVAYEWSDRSTDQTLGVDEPGLYCITAWDRNGCKSKDCVVISEVETPRLKIEGYPGFCETGTTIGVSEEFESYEWSNGSTNQDIFVDRPGLYSVTVSDNGCRDTAEVSVVKGLAQPPEIEGPRSICSGEPANLVAEEGYQSYQWSTGETGRNITLNMPGQYKLDVIGPEGCPGQHVFTIAEKSKPTPIIIGPEVVCPQDTTTFKLEGTFSSYLWSDGSTDSCFATIGGATISVIVQDSLGCEGTTGMTIEEFSTEKLEIEGQGSFCEGDFVNLKPTTGFRNYLWSTGSEEEELRVAAPGTYSLTVEDANGCQFTESIDLEEFEVPKIAIAGENYLCGGEAIELVAGEEGFQYSWSTGDTTASIVVSMPGTFVVEATNGNGCSDKAVIIVEEAENPVPTIEGDAIVCNGVQTQLEVIGAFETYQWSNGDTTSLISARESGNYSVTVTNDKGCMGVANHTVSIQETFEIDIQGSTSICTGQETTLDAGEGYASYLWSTGDSGQLLKISEPGIHSVTVTTSNGCIGEGQITVDADPLPPLAITGNPYFCQGGSTLLDAGAGFDAYSWDDGSDSRYLTVDTPGEYGITVSQQNGCQGSTTVTVFENKLPTPSLPAAVYLCPGSGAELSTDTAFHSYYWSTNSTNPSIVVDQPGTIILTVQDEFGCEGTVVSEVIERAPPNLAFDLPEVLTCHQSTTFLNLANELSADSYAFQWTSRDHPISQPNNAQSLAVHQPGWYILEVTDRLSGCSIKDSIEVVASLDLPVLEVSTPSAITCDLPVVSIVGTIANIQPSFEYLWRTENGRITTEPQNFEIVVDQKGEYEFVVTDLTNGCQSIATVSVEEDREPPLVDLGEDQALNCHQPMIQLANAQSFSGNTMTKEWYFEKIDIPFSTESTIEIDQPGQYFLRIVDQISGCSNLDSISVIERLPPSDVELIVNAPTCYDFTDGFIEIVEISGGAAPFQYRLNQGDYADHAYFENLQAGQHTLLIKDADQCELTQAIQLEEGSKLELSLGENRKLNFGESIELIPEINLHSSDIQKWWWEANTELACADCWIQEIILNQTTNFTFTAIDRNGCIQSDQITIHTAKPREFFIPNAFSPNSDGQNDVFFIRSNAHIQQIRSLRIFDRWGNQVYGRQNFAPNDPTIGWNGSSNTRKTGTGIYAYVAEIEFIDGETELVTGDIMLVE